jgi:lipopolysaccharide biosynthesis protein
MNQSNVEIDFLQVKPNNKIMRDDFRAKKTLVLYVFHEYHNRVEHFLKYCMFEDTNVDFIIISNNKNFKLTNLPANATFLARENIGYDFGGWSDALLINERYKDYDYFIFVNSSVIGPFMNSDEKWTDVYINGLQKNNIKLFGSTINTIDNPEIKSHVQSYIFSMDKLTLDYLIKCEIFSMTNYAKTLGDAVWTKEVPMSRKIIENNWNIGSLMTYYENVDFTFKTKKPQDYDIIFLNDVMNNNEYRNRVWNLYELVFIKGNRGVQIII